MSFQCECDANGVPIAYARGSEVRRPQEPETDDPGGYDDA